MTEIKVFVENLAAYNNGDSKGAWFTLPATTEEIFKKIFDADELDENGQPHGDFAIHDYEAPFKIKEFAGLDHLNEIAEVMESLSKEDIEIIVALESGGIINDLAEGQYELDNVTRYHDCKDMSDLAYNIVQERYGNDEEYRFFLRNFNYDSYGEELDSEGTYLELENDLIIEYTR